MPFVVSGIILVGVLCLLDMLMTFAVLRRLREHSARLAELPDFTMGGPAYAAKFLDRPLPEFSAQAVDGREVSSRSLAGRSGLIAVLRAGCGPCQEQLPTLAQLAGEEGIIVIGVVTGSVADARGMVGQLTDTSLVVMGPDADALAKTLDADVFPTYLEVDEAGVVVRAETHLSALYASESAELSRN
jgi:hypothetical protein